MPTLHNARHEAFAQQLVLAQKHGWSRGEAYSRSGYVASGHAAEANAHRLLKKAENGIAARVAEIVGRGALRAEVTAASVLERLDRVYTNASEHRQFSAAGRAAEAMAKIAGVGAADRIEIGGPGSFSPPSTEDMLQKVRSEIGVGIAASLSWLLNCDGDLELPISKVAEFTLAAMPMEKALTRLDELRDELHRVASEGVVLIEAAPQDEERDQIDHQALLEWKQPRRSTSRRDRR